MAAVPSIVLAGAAKCGTTALVAALATHPQCHAPVEKEPRFFARFEPCRGPLSAEFNGNLVTDFDQYLQLYANAGGRHTIDASTDYLTQPGVAERIRQRSPDAKVLIGLRHPLARAFSEHAHLLREDAETQDFLTAFDLEQKRIEQGWVPLFHHRARSTYAPGLSEFLKHFGANVLVYHHEDLRKHPETVMANITSFLDLDQPLASPPQANRGGAPRMGALNNLIRPRHPGLIRARETARKVVGPRALSATRRLVDRYNLAAPPPPSTAVCAELGKLFAADTDAVEDLLQTPLDHWRRVPAEWL